MNHERRVVGHAGGWKEQMDTCVCGKPWPCEDARSKEWFRIRSLLAGENSTRFHREWNNICAQAEAGEFTWILQLRSIGIKAAHPDDGWVDRTTSSVHDFLTLQNPSFNDGLRVGELIAIGEPDHYRVRRVLSVQATRLSPLSFLLTPKYQIRK